MLNTLQRNAELENLRPTVQAAPLQMRTDAFQIRDCLQADNVPAAATRGARMHVAPVAKSVRDRHDAK